MYCLSYRTHHTYHPHHPYCPYRMHHPHCCSGCVYRVYPYGLFFFWRVLTGSRRRRVQAVIPPTVGHAVKSSRFQHNANKAEQRTGQNGAAAYQTERQFDPAGLFHAVKQCQGVITHCYIVDNFLLNAEAVKQKHLTPRTVSLSSKNTLHVGIADQTHENGLVIDRTGKSIETLQAGKNAAERRKSGNNERRRENSRTTTVKNRVQSFAAQQQTRIVLVP